MKKKYKVVIENDSEKFKTLMLEPWGEDYGMMSKDVFEIIEEEEIEDIYFHIQFGEKYITVYVEGTSNSYPRIYQNGKELDCGYNRID
ncbi:MAG TPA: hypothetical protein PKE69_22270 [Pyrinomonadaceae bacterium]|nr:hypothetical protein [Pyrinomonadaceae bacterium]